MKSRQFIILCESDAKCQSDFMYISKFLRYYYDLAGNKLSPVFLAGKGNYAKKEAEIRRLKNKYAGDSVVILAVDLDADNHVNNRKNDEIRGYCQKNDYKFVWFCLDVEDVFLGCRVNQDNKGRKAKAYDPFKTSVEEKKLMERGRKSNSSNLLLVMGEFLEKRTQWL